MRARQDDTDNTENNDGGVADMLLDTSGSEGGAADDTGRDAASSVTEPPQWLVDVLPDEPLIATLIALGGVIALAMIAHFIARPIILWIVKSLVKRSRTAWDNVIIEHRTIHRLMPIIPLIVINRGIAVVPGLSEDVVAFIQRLAMATMVVVGVRALGALLSAVNAIYGRYDMSRGRPIKGFLQVIMIVAWSAAAVVVIAAIVDRSPLFFLSGLGAMTAILLLIFRDTILSLVAGVQLTSNDLIRVGDWIEMSQFNANGDVVDVALNYVKVQNWDRTVTVIPANKFLEHSFRNYRAMFESGGRRIKRSMHIDMNTIRFLDEAEIKRFSRFVALREYVQAKVDELDEYNRTQVPEDVADVLANGRHLTNIGTFRAYAINYLKRHAMIHQEMTLLVRQLEPGPEGLPIQVYAFTNDTGWVNYEGIQADIFDHLLAIVQEFGLRVFQSPAGSDVDTIGQSLRAFKHTGDNGSHRDGSVQDASNDQ